MGVGEWKKDEKGEGESGGDETRGGGEEEKGETVKTLGGKVMGNGWRGGRRALMTSLVKSDKMIDNDIPFLFILLSTFSLVDFSLLIFYPRWMNFSKKRRNVQMKKKRKDNPDSW